MVLRALSQIESSMGACSTPTALTDSQNKPSAQLALPIVIGIGVLMGAVHGFLITRMRLQPFVVTLCGLLIYRGVARYTTGDATAGFAFGQNFNK
jgi:ribose/xylose/arabinose/galactoside ABC-type transport system permease subunit